MAANLDARFEARRAAIEMSRPRTRARHIRWRWQLHRRRLPIERLTTTSSALASSTIGPRATFRPGNTNLPGFPFKELRNDDLAVDRVSAQSFLVDAGLTTPAFSYVSPVDEFLDATEEQIIAINLSSSFYGSQPASIHPGRAGRLRGESPESLGERVTVAELVANFGAFLSQGGEAPPKRSERKSISKRSGLG